MSSLVKYLKCYNLKILDSTHIFEYHFEVNHMPRSTIASQHFVSILLDNQGYNTIYDSDSDSSLLSLVTNTLTKI